ncbi:hypothetical protein P3X46_010659 [Hevea brasiliensis]|uniref:Protein kinase domain-containing protein n=1 Tax=Hevea brasiliensis TaxID=3981 RepID=A0ABQ9MIX8_HEVBR|nr:rust resistance kinase Lr10-like [Hevea brasiliensis]KAJ9178808.1 hypothetical protein P3X46_010659 [Hevea brasiliensis]
MKYFSLETSVSVFGLFVLVLGELGQALPCCPKSSCGSGPDIRFPFRLKDRQPEPCGYPGFDLSCTERNETLLELPDSVKLYIQDIDYVSQIINVSDPDECFVRQALNINFSASPFLFESSEQYLTDYTLFNCSSPKEHIYGKVPCLGVPGYEVYKIYGHQRISDFDLTSCTKMYNILSFPNFRYGIDSGSIIQLTWPKPACGLCEARGGTCELKSDRTESCNMSHQTRRNRGSSTKLIIAGATSVGSFILAVAFIALYRLYRADRKEKENQAKIEKFLEDYKALTPTRYSYADLKRITNQFKDKLGQGAYGEVFKGKLSSEILVAVKILNNSTGNGEEFINEVGTMGRIHHVNVVRLVGFCAEGFHRALVYEFLPNESLEKFIFSNHGHHRSLGWEKLQDIALGIAKGIEYLHQGCDQRILHFDIKPHNILLDDNFIPKISDFGLAKLCSKDHSVVSMTTARGTMGYIAPEVFSRNFGNVSCKSDVYSFGMLLLEMVGGRKNTHVNVENNSDQVFFPEWIYDQLDRGEDMRIRIEEEGDAKIAKKLTIVGLWCIQWFPIDRPSMTMVVQMLEGEGDDLAMPPNPFNSTGMPAGRRLHQDQLPVISEIE